MVLDEEEFGIESDMPPITSTVEEVVEVIAAPGPTGVTTTTTVTVEPVTETTPPAATLELKVDAPVVAATNIVDDSKGEEIDLEARKRAARAAKFDIPLKEQAKPVDQKKGKLNAAPKKAALTDEQLAAQALLDEKKRQRAERFGIPLKEAAPPSASHSKNKNSHKKRNRNKNKDNKQPNAQESKKLVDPELVLN